MKSVLSILALFPILVFSLFLLAPRSLAAVESTVDHRPYAQLLQKYVKGGVVDYTGFKTEKAQLEAYLDQLAGIDPDKLAEQERFAFYANAYNAWTIKLILDHYPGIDSIKDTGSLWQSPWKKKIARIDGGLLTLDEIEHDILRPQFKDPRVHFAINCAAKSCPPLYNVPFNGRELDRQLDHTTRSFINDPTSYRIEGDTLYVSRIFKWFSEDFNDDPLGFFEKYAEGPLLKRLQERSGQMRVKYLDYDWSLNGA
ncbi:MAG: DUF547 domain-containing protein [Desulfobacterales bacterium]|jgi:hypothetical protein